MFGFGRNAQGRATLGGTPLGELMTARGLGTPAYLYDLDAVEHEVRSLVLGFASARHLVAYAVKANSAGSILRRVARAGGGADVVSGGELRLALDAGIVPSRIVMSGVAKLDEELDLAIASEILAIQVESVEEVARIDARARDAGRRTPVALRVNPELALETHAHVATGHAEAKFGISRQDLAEAWRAADGATHLEAIGVSTHVGSTLRSPGPYLAAATTVCEVAAARRAAGHAVRYLDFGGGFGIDYGGVPTRPPVEFAQALVGLVERAGFGGTTLVVEPGRSMVGPHGVLVARVVQLKAGSGGRWVFLDAAMNDLIRPALYGARHRVEPLEAPPSEPTWRVAGPVCESADDFGAHLLGAEPSGLVVIRDAGAYGFTMASEYNGRPLATEAFVSGGRVVSMSQSRGREHWVQRRLEA